MKRSDIIAKLDTYKTLREQNLVSPEVLKQSIASSLGDGTLKKLPESAFLKEPAARVYEFAKEFDLVKVKGVRSEAAHAGGAEAKVLNAYPDVASAVAAIGQLKGRVFVISSDSGVDYSVVFQPFWRTVTKTGTTEGEVTL